MSRLYVFAVGGSGSKVVRSLTMLLASGLKLSNFTEIVPVIIDPDEKNKNVEETEKLLDDYLSLQSSERDFFNTKIKGLGNDNKFRYSLDIDNTSTFKDFIGYNNSGFNDDLKGLVDVLFSGTIGDKKLMDLKMSVGFQGNPNIGTVAMNNFANSKAFQEDFLANVNPNSDAVIFIGSIFGGTGASGVPVLVNSIRHSKLKLPQKKKELEDELKIAVVSMLPYYSIFPQNGTKDAIQSSHFIPKTRSALRYYEESLYKDINLFYYVGSDFIGKPLGYSIGGQNQRNGSYFPELVAALAILDFAEQFRDTPKKGEIHKDVARQFWETADNEQIKFIPQKLNEFANNKLKIPLTQLLLLKTYLDSGLKLAIEKGQPWTDTMKDLNSQNLNNFLGKYEEWLVELSENGQQFAPFSLKNKNISCLVEGKNSGISFDTFEGKLNLKNKKDKIKAFSSPLDKLLKFTYPVTKEISSSIFGGQNG